MAKMTREEYLTIAAMYFYDEVIMPATNAPRPAIKVSVGWPYGSRGGAKTIGQCFTKECSNGEHNEIFITPAVRDTKHALETLIHEQVHAVDNCASGHKGAFAKLARAIDLQGKLTQTHAGEELSEVIQCFIADHGELPHITMDDPTQGKAKPGSRMRKLSCRACGAVWRMSSKWAEQANICPCCESAAITKQ